MSTKTIVVGFDDSDPARRALAFAESLADTLGARLTLVHVVSHVYPMVGALPPVTWGEVEQAYRAHAKEILDKALHEVPTALQPKMEIRIGGGAEELSSVAESPDVIMVVVGSTGKGAITRALMGSVSGRLVRICPKPVVVVP